MSFNKLLSPITINKTTLKNRICVPPMGTAAVTPSGEVTDELVAYFDSMSKGGASLVVIEVADVDANRRYNTTVLGAFDDRFIPGWKRLADTIHKNDAKIFAQLLHAGPIPLIHNDPTQLGPVGASSVPHIYNRNRIPHTLTVDELIEIKQMYVDAVRRVREAGCDGVEIHCAHNHGLLGTFISQIHNKRFDEYGGDLRGRMKFPLEVIHAVRESVGADYPIGIRMSGAHEEVDGITIEDSVMMAKMFEEAGVDYLHVSGGTLISSYRISLPSGSPKGVNLKYAREIKKAVKIPVGCVGKIDNPYTAEAALEAGDIDMAFMGRATIADPEWPHKLMNGQLDDIRPCIGCLECTTAAQWGNGFFCSMNSRAGRELKGDIEYSSENKAKTVLVIGGGPGGLEAARVASLRGFKVILMEKHGHLGGQFELAAYPPTKQEYTCGLKYQVQQVNKLGVEVILNKEATKETIAEINPDAVIIATGGTQIMPNWLLNSPHPNIIPAWDAIIGSPKIGRNILVIGGGLVGCETADMIAAPHYYMQMGERKVSVIEMQEYVMATDFSAKRDHFMERLINKRVNIIENAKVEQVLEDSVTYTQDGEKFTLKHIDTIICAVGTKSENKLAEELKDLTIPVITVGDAVKPRKIYNATQEAAQAVIQLSL